MRSFPLSVAWLLEPVGRHPLRQNGQEAVGRRGNQSFSQDSDVDNNLIIRLAILTKLSAVHAITVQTRLTVLQF